MLSETGLVKRQANAKTVEILQRTEIEYVIPEFDTQSHFVVQWMMNLSPESGSARFVPTLTSIYIGSSS